VDRQIERLRDLNARNVAIDPPRPAAKGDVARLDYRLTFDDKPDAEPLVREGVEIELGAGYVLDEIADGVIGMSPGDEREVALSFPADHHLTAFAGRSAKAKLRLADLYDRKLPEMGDEFAKDLGEADLVSLRSSVRREMEAEADRSAESAANRGLLDRLVKRAGVSLPKQWLEKQFREKLESFRRTFGGGREVGEQEQGMLRREVDRQMRRAVVVAWLSRAHRLDATPEQVEAEMAAVAERLGRPLPAVKAEFAKRGTASLEADLTERNVLRFLREKAEVVDGEPPEEEGEEEIPGD
jgi:trigger factor